MGYICRCAFRVSCLEVLYVLASSSSTTRNSNTVSTYLVFILGNVGFHTNSTRKGKELNQTIVLQNIAARIGEIIRIFFYEVYWICRLHLFCL